MSGDTGIRLSPELLATYAGVYELAPGREAVVTVTGDLLFVQGLNEPKLPLLVQSETHFMSTATPTGFEFVKDAQGKVTHLIVRGAAGDQKAVRKGAPVAQDFSPAHHGARLKALRYRSAFPSSLLPRLECAAELVGERSEPLRRRSILAFGVLAHFLGLLRVQDRLDG